MTTYQPGDRVNIEIRDAEVTDIFDGGCTIRSGGETIDMYDAMSFTITPAAPSPAAGDVWRMADGDVLHILPAYYRASELEAVHATGCRESTAELDFTGAERLFPIPAPAAGRNT